jgi:HK97 family phage major capsid protein/HK97 family phage prohead protease
MNRAFSTLSITKAVEGDDGERIIEGIASTPSTDRMGDIVEPMGAKFALPLPLLWQHNHDQPVGTVTFAEPNAKGIPFRATIARVAEPGKLKDRVDEAWQSIKAGLIRAVSIGFSTLKHEIMKEGGYRFTEWEWLELSLVTVPAQREATINTIRSIVQQERAALGLPEDENVSPGATGSTPTTSILPVVNIKAPKEGNTVKTIAEQRAAFVATREQKSARMTDIMNTAAESGETLDAAASEEYDTLENEVKAIDAHIKRLATLEASQAAAATPVAAGGTTVASEARSGSVAVVKGTNLPKGTAFTRYAIALARSKGNLMQAVEISKGWDDTPEVETVLRAAVAAGTTTDATWAAPLVPYNQMASEFIELLRPQTIIGRMDNLRRVPFNISMPGQTAGSSVGWVGEGKPKPVGHLAFNTTTLRFTKCAGIVVLTDELVRFSNPSAEAVVRQDLTAAIAQFLDYDFVNPAKAAVADTSPASITNGAATLAASGTTAAAFRTDIKALFANFINANIGVAGCAWIMEETQALSISLMLNALGTAQEFPGITMSGGTLLGLPVIVSENIPSGLIVLAKPSEILLADDNGVTLDASREASLQMDSAPANGAAELVSLWQNNMVGLRAERYINWKRRRTGAVAYITAAAYA